ncbi:UDP-N-acetylmuramoyl-L-alanine--D-glutamate ligase, partial [Candidatus Pelagibacter sp.]|nr:UDP-N-acetylmuramoyl-L-alanine--D-glutamate ligase [Candidatus Pelagibacter sp.]
SKIGDKLNLKKSNFYDVKAYIYGRDKNFFENKLKNKIKCKKFKNLNDATKSVYNDISSDESLKHIIFSPAAASYDQYKNFEERGKKFNLIVKQMQF